LTEEQNPIKFKLMKKLKMTTETQKLNPSVVVLKTGEKLITVLQEAFEGEGEDQKGICLVMNHPYELSLIGVNNQENPEQDLQVKFSKWCPYAVDIQFRIPYDSVLAIGQPDPGLAVAYQAKVEQYEQITQNTKLQQEEIEKVINPEVV
jgi:hypothetical protein